MKLLLLIFFFSMVCGAKQFTIPNAIQPAQDLYIGHLDDPRFFTFLTQLESLPFIKKFKVIASSEGHKEVDRYIKKHRSTKIESVELSGDEMTVWTQDYWIFLQDIVQKRPVLFDMPYGRSGELVPNQLNKAVGIGHLLPAAYRKIKDDDISSADYGGNVFSLPYNLILIGQNMAKEVRGELEKIVEGKFIALDVDWLDTGHVDEIFSVVPGQGKGCKSFVMVQASPSLGIATGWYHNHEKTDDEYFSCFKKNYETESKKRFCNYFFSLNLSYQSLISKNAMVVDKALRETSGCKKIDWVKVPVLFAPASMGADDNMGSGAVSVHANPANLVALGQHLLVGTQRYKSFEQEITKIFTEIGLQVHYLQADHLVENAGGIHCNLNVLRAN